MHKYTGGMHLMEHLKWRETYSLRILVAMWQQVIQAITYYNAV